MTWCPTLFAKGEQINFFNWEPRTTTHGVVHSVVDLEAAINRFIAEHNRGEAKPFVWRAEPGVIIASRNRGFQALEATGG